jgi:hypothetical protein
MIRPRTVIVLLAVSTSVALLLCGQRGERQQPLPASGAHDGAARTTSTAHDETGAMRARHERARPFPVDSAPVAAREKVAFREDVEDWLPERNRQIRREIYQSLESFRDDTRLTESQWTSFLADLQESATMFGRLINDLGWNRIKLEDWDPISKELGRELEEKLARYLDADQMKLFRFRFRSSTLAAQLARGNILQDPDDPTRRAWDAMDVDIDEPPGEAAPAEAGNDL